MILDISICVAYLLIVFAVGLWFAREQHDNADYFVGGRYGDAVVRPNFKEKLWKLWGQGKRRDKPAWDWE